MFINSFMNDPFWKLCGGGGQHLACRLAWIA
jgi:hypothetical protein